MKQSAVSESVISGANGMRRKGDEEDKNETNKSLF